MIKPTLCSLKRCYNILSVSSFLEVTHYLQKLIYEKQYIAVFLARSLKDVKVKALKTLRLFTPGQRSLQMLKNNLGHLSSKNANYLLVPTCQMLDFVALYNYKWNIFLLLVGQNKLSEELVRSILPSFLAVYRLITHLINYSFPWIATWSNPGCVLLSPGSNHSGNVLLLRPGGAQWLRRLLQPTVRSHHLLRV